MTQEEDAASTGTDNLLEQLKDEQARVQAELEKREVGVRKVVEEEQKLRFELEQLEAAGRFHVEAGQALAAREGYRTKLRKAWRMKVAEVVSAKEELKRAGERFEELAQELAAIETD